LTLAEFLELPEDARCEIVDGILRPIATPSELHREVQYGLIHQLKPQRPRDLRVAFELAVVFQIIPPTVYIPDVLVYRRTERLVLSPDDPGLEEKIRQWQQVEAFFESFTHPADQSLRRGGVNTYATPEKFRQCLSDHLKALIRRRLIEQGAPFSGRVKVAFCDRLGNSWKCLAVYVEIPVSDPFDPITLWQGTTTGRRLVEFARPTARAAPGRPIITAISP
jgi:hypothetical protein